MRGLPAGPLMLPLYLSIQTHHTAPSTEISPMRAMHNISMLWHIIITQTHPSQPALLAWSRSESSRTARRRGQSDINPQHTPETIQQNSRRAAKAVPLHFTQPSHHHGLSRESAPRALPAD